MPGFGDGHQTNEGAGSRMHSVVCCFSLITTPNLIRLNSCLDDSELEFLGAPWTEYECVTKEIGIDVLRFVFSLPSSLFF